MTVQELISRLVTLDPEYVVVMPGVSEEFCVVGEAYIDTVRFNESGIPHLADARDGICTEVVRLFGDEGD